MIDFDMTPIDINDRVSEETLGAYIEGNLSDTEEAAVDAWLINDPDAAMIIGDIVADMADTDTAMVIPADYESEVDMLFDEFDNPIDALDIDDDADIAFEPGYLGADDADDIYDPGFTCGDDTDSGSDSTSIIDGDLDFF